MDAPEASGGGSAGGAVVPAVALGGQPAGGRVPPRAHVATGPVGWPERHHLSDMRNAHFWWSTAGDLYDRGFLLKKDGYADEPEEHWSVDLGAEPPSVDLVETFVSAFAGPERTDVT